MRQSTAIGIRVFLVVVFALGWEFLSRSGWTSPKFLPTLSSVLMEAWALLQQPKFVSDLALTGFEVIVAFLIVAPLGLAVGFYLGERRDLEQSLDAILNFLMAVPKSIFLPIFILALGVGLA